MVVAFILIEYTSSTLRYSLTIRIEFNLPKEFNGRNLTRRKDESRERVDRFLGCRHPDECGTHRPGSRRRSGPVRAGGSASIDDAPSKRDATCGDPLSDGSQFARR